MSNDKPSGRSPSSGRLDTNVSGAPPVPPGMETYLSSMESIARTMQDTQRTIATQLDQMAMFGNSPVANGARQARRSIGNDPLAGTTRIDTLKATRSLEGVQTLVSQRLGELIAGGPEKINYSAQGNRPASAGVGNGGRGSGGGGTVPPQRNDGPDDFFGNPFTGQQSAPMPDTTLGVNSQNMRQRIGQQIAEKGVPTSPNQFLDMMSQNVPMVGTYLDSAQEIKAQRGKNATYQRVTGGSNFSGFAQRWHEEWAATSADLNPFNPMSGAQTREAFKGVTSLGFSGRGRQDRLDFVQHQNAVRGMDVNQSLEALSIAAQNGKTNLDSLNDSLYGVSKAAEQAGVNADMARKQFLTLFGTATQQGLGGGANVAASVLQGTMTSYGRQFQNTDSTGLLSRTMTYRFAAQSGMTPGQFQGSLRRGDPRAYRAMTNNTMQMTANRLTPEQINFIRERIERYTNGNSNILQTDAGSQIVSQIADEFRNQFEGQVDFFALSDYFSRQTGRTLDPSNVVEFIVQQVGGNTEAVRAQRQAGETNITDKSGRSLATGQQVGVTQTGLDDGNGPGIHTRVHAGYLGLGAKKNKAVQAYRDWRSNNNENRDPVIEGLLQQVKNPNDTKVSVLTSDGVRVMSLADAIRDYPNSVARGDVQIVEGDKTQRGQTINQILGGHVDANRSLGDELSKPATGETYGHWESKSDQGKANRKAAQGGGGTIDLSDEAKRWFRYMPNSGAESAASGYPMDNPNASYGSR